MRRVKSFRLSRRALIRGSGYALALPWLAAMAPKRAHAQAARTPNVMFLFFSTGYRGGTWMNNPSPGISQTWSYPKIASALEPLKAKTTLITGLRERPGSVGNGGAGIHARATGCFLVHEVLQRSRFAGDGISADQVIAQHLNGKGEKYCIDSLVLGMPGERPATFAEDGYGNVFLNNISFTGPSTKVQKESNPADLLKRLVTCPAGAPGAGQAGAVPSEVLEERTNFEKSVMGSVKTEAQRLMNCVGREDKLRLDEYFNSISELERRFLDPTKKPATDDPNQTCSMPNPVTGDPGMSLKAATEAMFPLAIMAYKCGLTKVGTMMLDGAFSRRNYGVPGNESNYIHGLSHGEINGKGRDHPRWELITTHYFELIAQFLKMMDAVNEGDGTMLDNSIVYIGSEYGNGDAHQFSSQPMIIAGGGGGKLKMGVHIAAPNNMEQANAVLNVLQAVGVPRTSFGDSTGPIPGLAV